MQTYLIYLSCERFGITLLTPRRARHEACCVMSRLHLSAGTCNSIDLHLRAHYWRHRAAPGRVSGICCLAKIQSIAASMNSLIMRICLHLQADILWVYAGVDPGFYNWGGGGCNCNYILGPALNYFSFNRWNATPTFRAYLTVYESEYSEWQFYAQSALMAADIVCEKRESENVIGIQITCRPKYSICHHIVC